jgi:hypothetical protein
MIAPRILSRLIHWSHKFVRLCPAIVLLLSNLFLASCTGLFGGNQGPSQTAISSELAVGQLHWCRKPSLLFRDEGAVTATPTTTTTSTPRATATTTIAATTSGTTATTTMGSTPTTVPGTPRTISDWSEVKANIGFTVFLPSKLPENTCLVNAQATIHDPIIGGSFTIGYLLPDHSALTLSEAPFVSQNSAFQCSSSAAATPHAKATGGSGTPALSTNATQGAILLLCSGAKGTTNIVMSARGSADHLQQIFNNLQPNINWIPTS